ncbi:unnamed protein product, partial [Mesorhabditis belari]|uniref:J domain-containing protein n=1 Tax=Mesorhabditis belari TaxID=2138241 RepID=A0AAF3ED49_9BILA
MANFCSENRDIACYLLTKLSWKGKYKRIFSIGTLCVTTYNPQTLEVTNQWNYEDIISIKPSPKNTPDARTQDEFIVLFRKKDKRDNMRFASEHFPDIVTDCLQHYQKFVDKPKQLPMASCLKHSWSARTVSIRLRIVPYAIEQIDERNVLLAVYPFKNIRSIVKLRDRPNGFVIEVGEHRRRHIFETQQCDQFLTEIRKWAADYVGVSIPFTKEALTLDDAMMTRLGLCSRDDRLTSYVEFNVQKFSPRHQPSVRRLLCLSDGCLIERDKSTYHVICATPLNQIICLVRLEKDPQQFVVEFVDGKHRAYAAPERDLILASLIDGTRASGNEQVFVIGHRFDRSLRLMPYSGLLDEDAESQCMRHIIAPPLGLRRTDLVRRFNANIPYNGLTYATNQEGFFTENKGKIIVQCLECVLQEKYTKEDANAVHRVEAQLQCLRRLFASKSGFHAFTEVAGIREKLGDLVVRCLQWKNEAIDHAVVETLCALMRPMHNFFELRIEQLNKQSLLSSAQFVEHLLDLVVKHVERQTGALVIAAMLDFLTYAICAPFSETTHGETFDTILKLVAIRGRSFYTLFHSPSMTIIKGAGMVMRAIIEESDVETSKAMQLLALSEGSFLTHLNLSLLSMGTDLRVRANRQLSGHLLSLWLVDNQCAEDLMQRSLPRGLLEFLNSDAPVPVKEADLLLPRNNLEAASNELKQKNPMLEKMEGLKITAEAQIERFIQNWDLEQKLNFKMTPRQEERKDKGMVVLRRRRASNSTIDLIWNEETRGEFRNTVENELRILQNEKEQAGSTLLISWNHAEFHVGYKSLTNEIKIGDYFLRQLLSETDETATPIHKPVEFFNNVYHRLLLSTRSDMRCLCLKAMAIAYSRHHITIGPVADVTHFVTMLQHTNVPMERDHLILLLSKLVLNKSNARELLGVELVRLLVELASLAHLHTNRATLNNQSNVIEATPNQMGEGPAEWYYQVKKDDRHGPFSFPKMKELFEEKTIFEKTWIWAAGMENWEPLSKVPQFRWTICSTPVKDEEEKSFLGNALYNFSELAAIALEILLQMCEFFPSRDEKGCVVRPMPSVKLQLTSPSVLKCVVQLLLTYDSTIVQRVSSLLFLVMQDNPFMPSLYLTGLFFFILMYNGSNVLPIARLLHLTHKKQAFRSALPKFEGTHSVLAPLLPEAAIFYLEHYGPEKYAEVYLGEFDNPEVIWNNKMRRHLIERIALHISEYSARLMSNVKALYTFCPITEVDYPELESELFCHVYYLRHLCDQQRFPNWPIRDPVAFLRSCLAAWHEEIDRKPPAMSIEMACETLGIDPTNDQWMDAANTRRAYLKLSLKYHPDKNPDPEARDIFQKISSAYELLTSNNARRNLPDPERIVLCLRAQSIVYSGHLEELGEYKYAGYGQLIKTIDLEAKDAQLFQKGGGSLLAAAIELAKWTLQSSALNAEQLRRENGLEALQLAFERCAPMINLSSKPDDMATQVCERICDCLGTAARFEGCRARIAEMSSIFGNITRLLQFTALPKLVVAASNAISAMSVDTLLQMQFFQNGILWQLIPHLFLYDYTLAEGGVQHSEDSNKQAQVNRLSIAALESIASLAGYRESCPENEGVQRSVRALLTPYASRCMKNGKNDEVLKTLNSNTENPYLVWDNGTRAELLEFVEKQRTSTGNMSDLFGAEFTLSVCANEFIVGDVFIRIYNDQPNFDIEDLKGLCVDLLDFLEKHASQLCGDVPIKTNNDNLIDIDWGETATKGPLSLVDQACMCLTALHNLFLKDPAVVSLLIGHFRLLLRFLRCTTNKRLQKGSLKILSQAAGTTQCLSDISSVLMCSTLYTILTTTPEFQEIVLNILKAFASNTQLVKELLEYGGIAYLLPIVLTSPMSGTSTERILTASLLAHLQADKLTGPIWTRFINKFLPPIFADALRDSVQTAVSMLDTANENPELIWNDGVRKTVLETLERDRANLLAKQQKNPGVKWDFSAISGENWCAYKDTISGELIIHGVFVRLYVQNPGWNVRHPKQFCQELVHNIVQQLSKPTNNLMLLTTALVELLRHHPGTADAVKFEESNTRKQSTNIAKIY